MLLRCQSIINFHFHSNAFHLLKTNLDLAPHVTSIHHTASLKIKTVHLSLQCLFYVIFVVEHGFPITLKSNLYNWEIPA